MSRYTVIADVGNTLISLLKETMIPEPISEPELIGLASPADKGDLKLTLYLYKVTESGEFRNSDVVVDRAGIARYSPMALNLHYLLTTHSNSEISSRAMDEQRILGRAMQVFYDNSIIRAPKLKGSLEESDEEIRIVLENLPMDELSKIWSFSGIPYKPSIVYNVGPVYLDSTKVKSTKRVLEFDTKIKD